MARKIQATWGGRFSEKPSALMVKFSESVSFDQRLAPFDIQGSQAHAAMLAQVGLISRAELAAIRAGLATIRRAIELGRFRWQPRLEDVHMNIEQALAKLTPAAAKLHTARSRNDQIAVDMRLFLKHACACLQAKLRGAGRAALSVAEANRGVFVPGYTHLQRAQPVPLAHHLLAWLEMLERDHGRLVTVADHANWCPLGSGAIAGTTLPIDREFVAQALGFVDVRGRPRLTQNSMDAVADRDLLVEFAFACAATGAHLSRIAEDLILWASAEFGFVALPDAFCTGSSLMPQKRNPDACELLRAKAARLQGNLHTLLTLVKGLPLTYQRDLQEDKPPIFDSFDQTALCLDVLAGILAGMKVNPARCAAAVADPTLLATDLADYLVRKGVPFREAHFAVGSVVRLAEKGGVPLPRLTLKQVRSIHPAFGPDWTGVFSLPRAMAQRVATGMPGPAQLRRQFARWRKLLG
ncbi:MAG TPA: argininosuccinate lyase [Opitutaceae bacterium]|nr:argininosuccinate lyase [Opitutaceae bacterium]